MARCLAKYGAACFSRRLLKGRPDTPARLATGLPRRLTYNSTLIPGHLGQEHTHAAGVGDTSKHQTGSDKGG
jgi:hypothetical protein